MDAAAKYQGVPKADDLAGLVWGSCQAKRELAYTRICQEWFGVHPGLVQSSD